MFSLRISLMGPSKAVKSSIESFTTEQPSPVARTVAARGAFDRSAISPK